MATESQRYSVLLARGLDIEQQNIQRRTPEANQRDGIGNREAGRSTLSVAESKI
jgi:hypothetical protein